MDKYDQHGNLSPGGRYVLWTDYAQTQVACRVARDNLRVDMMDVLRRIDDFRRVYCSPIVGEMLDRFRREIANVCNIELPEDEDTPERRHELEIERQIDRSQEETDGTKDTTRSE